VKDREPNWLDSSVSLQTSVILQIIVVWSAGGPQRYIATQYERSCCTLSENSFREVWFLKNGLDQPFSIFLPWRNPWNNDQVSGNPYIKIIISTAHGTLAWSVSCRYNIPIIIVNAVLSREWYFSVDLFIVANKFKKRCLFFFSITISRGIPSDISRNPRMRNLGLDKRSDQVGCCDFGRLLINSEERCEYYYYCDNEHHQTEYCCPVTKIPASYSGGPGFKSLPIYWLYLRTLSVVFLCPYRQMPGFYLKLSHDQLPIIIFIISLLTSRKAVICFTSKLILRHFISSSTEH
jgi:hypothetical protein